MESLKQLSERARSLSHEEWRTKLIRIHTDLDVAIDRFWRNPTAEALTEINGLWSHAHSLYRSSPSPADPQPPLSGAPTAPQLALPLAS